MPNRSLLPSDGPAGYDIIILSDLLHFGDAHDVLIQSIDRLLKRSQDAVAHVSAGKYTKSEVCDNFLQKADAAGLNMEEIITDPSEPWLGELPVKGLSSGDLALRKANCRYWIATWKSP